MKLIKWSGVVLLALLALAAVFLFTFDISRYRDTIQETASRALGRDVVLQGKMSMALSLQPAVVIRDVRVANPAWAARPHLATIEELQLGFELLPLLSGELHLTRLDIEKADILLQRDANGNANWTFDHAARMHTEAGFPGIDHMSVQDSKLAYLRADGSVETLAIGKAESALRFDRPLTLTLSGQFRQQPVEALFKGSRLGELPALSGSWPFTLAVHRGAARLQFDGDVEKHDAGTAVTASLELAGQNIQELSSLLNFTSPGTGPYRFTANLNAAADTLRFREVQLDVAIPGAARHIRVAQGEAALGKETALNVSLSGSYGKLPVDIRITGGTLPVMLGAVQPWDLSLRVNAAQNRLDLSGKVSDLFKDNRLDLQLTMQGDDPRLLDPLFGMALPDTGSYHLRIGLSGEQRHYVTRIAPSTLGRTDIQGEIAVDARAAPVAVKASLSSSLINLDDFLPEAAIEARKKADLPLLQQPLALTLPQFNMVFDVRAGQIHGLPAPVSKAELRGQVDDKQLRLDRLDVSLPVGRIQGDLTIAPAARGVHVDARLNSPALDVSRLQDAVAVEGTLQAAHLSVTGAGPHLEELLAQSAVEFHAGNSKLDYRHNDKLYSFGLESFDMKSHAGQPLQLGAKGHYREVPVSLEMTTGVLMDVARGIRPLPLRFTSIVADNRLQGQGMIDKPGKGKGLQLALTLTGQQLESLEPVFAVNLLKMGPYELRGNLVGGAGEYAVDDLGGTINRTDVNGTLTVLMKKPRPHISAKLHGDKLYYEDIFARRPKEKVKTRVIPEVKLPEKFLRAVDVDMTINARQLYVDEVDYDNFSMQASLRDGRLQVTPMHALLNNGTVSSELYINARDTVPVAKLKVNATKVDYGELFQTLGISDKLEGEAEVSLDLSGTGHSTRELLASSNGHALLISGKGKVKQSKLDLWASGLITYMLTSAWQPAQEAEVNCIVGRFDVKNGIARSDTLLFDTTRITIAGSGTLNLGNEELNAVLEPSPKNPTFLSVARPAAVTGTLAEPRISAVAAKTGWTLGGLLAGFASPATLLFTFTKFGAHGANPCLEAVKQREQTEDAAQQQNKDGTQELLQKTLQPGVPAQ